MGRLVMFKELLRIDAMPLIVRDEDRALYVRGLGEFTSRPGYLIDTLLYERDYYRTLVDRFAPNLIRCTYNDRWDRAHVEAMAASGGIVNLFVHENRREQEEDRGLDRNGQGALVDRSRHHYHR